MFKPQSIISAGNFEVSIGRMSHQVAIFSKSSGEVCKFANIRKGGRLAKIKRKFAKNIVSERAFFFEHMRDEDTETLIKWLKAK